MCEASSTHSLDSHNRLFSHFDRSFWTKKLGRCVHKDHWVESDWRHTGIGFPYRLLEMILTIRN